MTDDNNGSGLLRTASETASILDIKTSTLRKYTLQLEKAGYSFYRSERNHRAYTPDDVTILQRFMDLKNNRDMTVERSANALVASLKENSVATIKEGEKGVMTYDQLQDLLERQEDFNKALLERLDKQQEYIEKRLDEQSQRIMNELENVKEAKRIEHEEKKPWFKFW